MYCDWVGDVVKKYTKLHPSIIPFFSGCAILLDPLYEKVVCPDPGESAKPLATVSCKNWTPISDASHEKWDTIKHETWFCPHTLTLLEMTPARKPSSENRKGHILWAEQKKNTTYEATSEADILKW